MALSKQEKEIILKLGQGWIIKKEAIQGESQVSLILSDEETPIEWADYHSFRNKRLGEFISVDDKFKYIGLSYEGIKELKELKKVDKHG